MIILEPIDDKHSASIQEIITDPELSRTSDIPSSPEAGEAIRWITRMKRLEEQGAGLTFAIVVDGIVVGCCGLYGIDKDRGVADLGFFLGRSYWGRGYATEGSGLLLTRAFDLIGLHSVRASCLVRNVPANRVLEKLGFRQSHSGPPPHWSKFPATEQYQYWSLTNESPTL